MPHVLPDPHALVLESGNGNSFTRSSEEQARLRSLLSSFRPHASLINLFQVYVTEAQPRGLGLKTAEALTAAGISCTVVLDSAVSYVMEKVDFVLVGSEAVVESGGLVNAIGSLNAAIIAKAANKPFYALAER